jgi:hypothetical protein
LISDSRGGCFSLELVGNFTDFLPHIGHGLTSIGFPTIFPSSFRFLPSTPLHHCFDLRDAALAFNVVITCLLFLILRPKPVILFWCLVCIGFWHITLFSQPRTFPPDISDGFGTFLPVLFIAYAFWRLAWRFVLPAFSDAPIERMIWFVMHFLVFGWVADYVCYRYLGPFWVGVLTNLTTDRVPIDRLNASDIKQQAGGVTALVIICIVLLFIVINQVRVIRKTGWLPWYAMWYAFGGLVALVIALLPTLNIRIHHYILAMILMPGTAFPTRLSAIYQGLLLGMFLNGAAAFGLASMFQTAAEVRHPVSSLGAQTDVTTSPVATRRHFRVALAVLLDEFIYVQCLCPVQSASHHMGRPRRRLGRICPARRRCGAVHRRRPQLYPISTARRYPPLFQARGEFILWGYM